MKTTTNLTLIAASLALASCCTLFPCKITPPPTSLSKNTEATGKIAAELQKLNVSGELSGSWKKTVTNSYAALNDDNATYYLLLEAIRCERQCGSKESAQQMFNLLEEEMRARRISRDRVRSGSGALPPELETKRAEVRNLVQ